MPTVSIGTFNLNNLFSRFSFKADLKDAAVVQLGQLGDDPPWPHLVVEIEKCWPHSEFWGDRPGGSRWHRLIPTNPVDVTHG